MTTSVRIYTLMFFGLWSFDVNSLVGDAAAQGRYDPCTCMPQSQATRECRAAPDVQKCHDQLGRVSEAISRIQFSAMTEATLARIRCLREGGTMEACFGILKLLPPKDPRPYQIKIDKSLRNLTRKQLFERVQKLQTSGSTNKENLQLQRWLLVGE